MVLPGFTAKASLYISEVIYKNKVRTAFGWKGEISPQAFVCQTGSCFECKYYKADSYEDPFTELGPPTDGCWKRCCNSLHDGWIWRRCSGCTMPPPPPVPCVLDSKCACHRSGVTGRWECGKACRKGTKIVRIDPCPASACPGGCPSPFT